MESKIKVGSLVNAIVWAWREDELPTSENFFKGKVARIIQRTQHSFWVKIEGLDKLIPMDRVSLA